MTLAPARIARGALSGLFFLGYGLCALPYALTLPLRPKRMVRAEIRLFYRLFVALARFTRLFRVECSACDRETLRATRGRVVVMNHVSLIDVVILLAHLGDSVCVSKAAVKKNPFLAAVARKIFISNDAGAARAIEEARSYLKDGVNVIVFPEGTRVPVDAPNRRFGRGAARFALASGVEVVACHIAYDPSVLGKKQAWWDVGEREILVKLSCRGVLAANGENDHRNAVVLTEKIKETIQ